MKYTIQRNENVSKTRIILDVLSGFKPFSIMSTREKDIFAVYIDIYFRYMNTGDYEKDEVFDMIFGNKGISYVANKLSTENKRVSVDFIRNYNVKLKKKGLINHRSIKEKILNIFNTIDDEIIFLIK